MVCLRTASTPCTHTYELLHVQNKTILHMDIGAPVYSLFDYLSFCGSAVFLKAVL